MLYEEVCVLRRLDHPNIVKFYGGCLRPPGMFLAVELMRTNLQTVIHGAPQKQAPSMRSVHLAWMVWHARIGMCDAKAGAVPSQPNGMFVAWS
jgi:serine/threonine protein kinase